jgi:hypothetical protein
MNFNENIKKIKEELNKRYSETTNYFFNFMIENNISFTDLSEINKSIESFKDFSLIKKENSVFLSKGDVKIEITFVVKNTFKKLKRTKDEYDLESLEEGSILDIVFIRKNEYYLFSSDDKEVIIQDKEIQAVFSPTKKDWHASIFFKDDFYNKASYFEFPCKQIHYIKNQENNAFYKLIALGNSDFLPLEFYKNKAESFGSIISDVYIDDTNLIKPLINK